MPKRQRWIAAGFLLAASGVAFSAAFLGGCGSGTSTSPGDGEVASTDAEESAHRTTGPKPLLEGWTTPQVALLISAEQHGYLEPCGCSEKQAGGISRRADLVRKLEKKGWTVTGLDAGGTVLKNRLQSWLKFQTTLAALKDMNYEALALGAEELRFTFDQLLSLRNLDKTATDEPPAFLGANVVLDLVPDYGPSAARVITANGTKIGVTSVVGPSLRDTISPAGAETGITVNEPGPALEKAVAELKEQSPDLLVLLSHASIEESKQFASEFPDFDLVVTTGGPEDPSGRPEKLGETLLLQVGRKGKYAGVVGYYPDAEQKLRFELVELDKDRFEDVPEMRAHMRDYQEMLRREQERVFADIAGAPHPSGSQFVGAAKCGECHTKAYSKWKTSKHSHAYESLTKGRAYETGEPISRVYDAECLSCHVTGWGPYVKGSDLKELLRYDSGFLTEELAAAEGRPHLFTGLQGQQCENCHGPGSRHVEVEQLWKKRETDQATVLASRRDMHLTKEIARDHLCIRCHDLENSPDFEFDKFWKDIEHPWRD